MQNAIPEWRRTARHYPGGPVSQPGEAAAGSGGKQPVAAHQLGSGVRQVLEELGEELQGGEQPRVCLEVRIVLRAVQHASLVPPAALRAAAGQGIFTDMSIEAAVGPAQHALCQLFVDR